MTDITGTLLYPDGSPRVNEEVVITLLDAFETASAVIYPYEIRKYTNAAGYFSQSVQTPSTGTAHYQITAVRENLRVYIADGPPVDLVTLRVTGTVSVSPDPVATLIANSKLFGVTVISSGPYTVQETDDYLTFDNAPYSVYLPPAIRVGAAHFLFNGDLSNDLTVLPDGTDQINKSTAARTLFPSRGCAYVCRAVGFWDAIGALI